MHASSLMTFLGGPRACIGYQFTLIESVHRLHPQTSFVKVLTTVTPQDEMSFVSAHLKVRVRVGTSCRGYCMVELGGSSATICQGRRTRWSQVAVIRQGPQGPRP